MRKPRTKSLWWGTMTLTTAALTSRGLGLIYRMLLARFLGSEGLGFFQMIFPFYIALVTLCVAGTPIAVSQMLAEGRENARTLIRIAILIVLTISIPLIIFVVLWARPLAMTLYHDPRFVPLLWGLAPALLAVAFSSVLRGYFIGRQQMEYPAASQVAEQLARVAILMALLNLAGAHLFPNAPLIAVLLIPLGEAVSLSILAFGYFHQTRVDAEDGTPAAGRQVAWSILRLSVPVTVSRLLGSLIGVIEASLIPLRLQMSGMSRAHAIQYFGQLTGMALPLILFPTALTVSLSTNLIPAIAESHAKKDLASVRRYIVDSVRATALLTVPVTVILLPMGVQLDDLFFHANIPSKVFIPLVIGGFFLYFDIAFAGILRGLGRTDIPLWTDLGSSVLEIGLIWTLASKPGHGSEGIALAVAIGFVVSCALNVYYTLRLTGVAIPWFTVLGKPMIASLPIWLVVPLWEHLAAHLTTSHIISLFSTLGVASVIYAASLSLSGTRWRHLT